VTKGGVMGKYDGLYQFLENLPPEITERTLTFEEIKRIIGNELPPSAFRYRAWWSNGIQPQPHCQAESWLGAGWRVDSVDQKGKSVCFRRGSAD